MTKGKQLLLNHSVSFSSQQNRNEQKESEPQICDETKNKLDLRKLKTHKRPFSTISLNKETNDKIENSFKCFIGKNAYIEEEK